MPVITADDLVLSRGSEFQAPRDNIMFELGLFMGGLVPDRTFGVCRDDGKIKPPSDLAGVTLASYDVQAAEQDPVSALGPAAMLIRQAIREHGCIPRGTRTPGVWLASRMAWSLMFPYRRSVLRANPALVVAFRAAVSRVRDALATERLGEDEFTEYLRHDLSRRERLLEALLSENSETRIRELLAAERTAAEGGWRLRPRSGANQTAEPRGESASRF